MSLIKQGEQPMKLLSIAIPCYQSQEYMANAIESLLPGGERVEILIVDDGSKDDTARIADEYAAKYPSIVRAIHQENGGHGAAVMTGLRNASGRYFKVIDSDDWADRDAFPRVLETLERFSGDQEHLDMLICNYIYDKAGAKHKHVVNYHHALPQNRVFGWNDAGRFRKGQYLQMHSIIYRTQLLLDCGLELPRHTFYVDELYACVPLPHVNRMYYLDADLYHYFIGREDQSVQEEIMIRRIDQALRVNRMLVTEVDPYGVGSRHLKEYLINYLEIITTVSSTLLIKSGTEENLNKKGELWQFIREKNPALYRELRGRLFGRVLHMESGAGRKFVVAIYRIARKIYGFN